MPVKTWTALGLGLCASLQLSNSLAASSIWPPRATAQSAMIADYRTLSCSKQVPAPYTGSLQLQSKYDQRDASKSTLRSSPDANSEQIGKQVKQFIGGLIYASKRFQRAKNPQEANMALACQDQWLERWAQAGALLNPDASSTGMAARKWAVAAMASTLLLTQAASDAKLQLSPAQKAWFSQLGERIIAEYQPRRTPGFTWFNNHDYWAAWAVAATGMLVQRDDFIQWADGNLRRGLQQAVKSSDGNYAYLPLEVARSKLAATYSQYALVPLVLLAESARANGLPWSSDDQQTLELLANFAARSILDPDGLPELKGQSQTDVAPYKLAWLIPFLQRAPGNRLARQLYDSEDGEVDNYSQIGGPLKPFYPKLP
ncbi:polysaccharide lyase [Pseudomonas donghuensis]|uniref:Polysaccharide lyase n=1 Tax=Pseudomonas donghuensis TaxID=1163398 RepID=A0AAP0SG54_9PSED|nr:polysaccharide lyase [Pseudomonas donghuensis]MDF9893183.1 poly(beta-D-mannuronate) lyase [Pseudomonas vranovensis]KDN98602.1 polysaccharide lyase [Pseudomonas donghuensis]MBF4207263.1 polysaccharide lyase [Pseudomonas donghuensis]MCP6691111.1 polysaccharide lyase [Pseudomonas donghuensis]MCP6696093.1 polysaccharide lyase [Pseudomonas donghuensis]